MKYLFLVLCFFLFVDADEYTSSLNIVTDTERNIMWQDNREVTEYLETFITAEVYCDSIVLSGYIDWRVPTIYELLNIIEVNEKNAVHKAFKYVSKGTYNTSSTFIENSESFLGVDFTTGKILNDKKMNENYIRCVRDIL
jgi:hypothetical protein